RGAQRRARAARAARRHARAAPVEASRADHPDRPREGRDGAEPDGPRGRAGRLQPAADPARTAGLLRPETPLRGVRARRLLPLVARLTRTFEHPRLVWALVVGSPYQVPATW